MSMRLDVRGGAKDNDECIDIAGTEFIKNKKVIS